MQIEHIHWQWKQIASEKSFHSISLFVNERICFPSLIVSRVDFPLEMPFYMDWPWEEIFGNWGYIYGSNDGFFDKRFPYQRGFICRKKPINESLSTSRRDSNDPGLKRGNWGKYTFIPHSSLSLTSVVLYLNVVGIFILEGDTLPEVGLFTELY